jgi:hypothetical protein
MTTGSSCQNLAEKSNKKKPEAVFYMGFGLLIHAIGG